jgi:hypothetical protein
MCAKLQEVFNQVILSVKYYIMDPVLNHYSAIAENWGHVKTISE